MARFKQVPQNFLFRKVLKYFGNMVRNYDGNCRDDDFFAVVRNCFDHDKAVELIEAACSEKEIEAMAHSRSRNGRLDLSDPLDDVFSELWNNEPARGKCRIVLDAVREYMEKDCGSPVGDIVGKRLFFERMFKAKLSDDEFVELKELANLAPGDFRTVRQEQFYLGGEVTNADRVAALKEECALKKDGVRQARIGF